MAGNRIDCANICKHDTTCFGFEHSKGNCRIFDQTPIGLKWGSVDVGIPHYECKDGWYLNNWSREFLSSFVSCEGDCSVDALVF
jgi:hypothetical protein